MPRKPDLDTAIPLQLMLPGSIRGKLDLHLYSEVEARVPKGAYQAFFLDRIREFFGATRLDLAPYLVNALPGLYVVRGSPEAIEQLKRRLEIVA